MTPTNTAEVRMPALSQTMEYATIIDWLVAPGDQVRQGQALAEVATDKVNMELESPMEGTVAELLVAPGDTVAVGALVALLTTDSIDLLGGLEFESPGSVGHQPQPEPVAVTAGPARGTHIVPASPPARVLARRLGIDLALVPPTGGRGQITPTDVKNFADNGDSEKRRLSPGDTVPPSPMSAPSERVLATRRATARIMTASAAIPQFTLRRVLELDGANTRRGKRSWTTELVCSLAAALRHHPELNSHWSTDTEAPVPWPVIAIGIAVDRPDDGLIVPAVTDIDQLGRDRADKIVRELVARVASGEVHPGDLDQASLTLSNLGGSGVDQFDALLFPPQAAIVSVGSIKMRPIATADGAIKAALTCAVGLTVDHRVIDGANAARFFDTFANLMQGD